jgi:hypothetical protein
VGAEVSNRDIVEVLNQTTDPPWTLRGEPDGTTGVYLIRPHLQPPHDVVRVARFDNREDAQFAVTARTLVPDLIQRQWIDERHPVRHLFRSISQSRHPECSMTNRDIVDEIDALVDELRMGVEQWLPGDPAPRPEPDTRTPQERALPRPSTTPPMWANDPTRTRRRRNR